MSVPGQPGLSASRRRVALLALRARTDQLNDYFLAFSTRLPATRSPSSRTSITTAAIASLSSIATASTASTRWSSRVLAARLRRAHQGPEARLRIPGYVSDDLVCLAARITKPDEEREIDMATAVGRCCPTWKGSQEKALIGTGFPRARARLRAEAGHRRRRGEPQYGTPGSNISRTARCPRHRGRRLDFERDDVVRKIRAPDRRAAVADFDELSNGCSMRGRTTSITARSRPATSRRLRCVSARSCSRASTRGSSSRSCTTSR